jgi:putative transposase
VYIDLNMVRAGVVDHPIKWVNSGYHEIQQPPKRYRVIELPGLFGLCGFSKLADFQQAHRQWVKIALRDELSVRDARWSEAVAVGSLAFVEKVKGELGAKALHRELEQIDGTYALRESGEAYRGQIDSKNEALTPENTLLWERITEVAAT